MSQFEKVLLTFLTITTQIKLYHWQTLSHPRHVASGDLYSELDELVDKFIEALQGRLIVENSNPNFRILLSDRNNTITLKNYNDNDVYTFIINIKGYLENNEFISVIGRYSDLVNLKDEMLNVLNKTAYLFSLKA
jgi:hypothetical protein